MAMMGKMGAIAKLQKQMEDKKLDGAGPGDVDTEDGANTGENFMGDEVARAITIENLLQMNRMFLRNGNDQDEVTVRAPRPKWHLKDPVSTRKQQQEQAARNKERRLSWEQPISYGENTHLKAGVDTRRSSTDTRRSCLPPTDKSQRPVSASHIEVPAVPHYSPTHTVFVVSFVARSTLWCDC